jgi:3-isopropylmalate dehydrogenase
VFVPGDGIGPEVISAGRRVLEGAGRIFGFGFNWSEVLIGGVAIDAYGIPMRDEDLAACADADAVYFGAIGDPKYDDPKAKVRPEQALLALRKGLALYANLRPVSIQPVLRSSSPVKESLLEGVDMMIVRELTGGLYFGKPSGLVEGGTERQVVDTLTYTETEIRRVVKLAFELARQCPLVEPAVADDRRGGQVRVPGRHGRTPAGGRLRHDADPAPGRLRRPGHGEPLR